jgi:hypothetical protein
MARAGGTIETANPVEKKKKARVAPGLESVIELTA